MPENISVSTNSVRGLWLALANTNLYISGVDIDIVIESATKVIKAQADQIKQLSANTVPDEELESLALGPKITVNMEGNVTINEPDKVEEPSEPLRDVVAFFASDIDHIVDLFHDEEKEEFWLDDNPYMYKEELLKDLKDLVSSMDIEDRSTISMNCASIAANAMFISDKAGDLRSRDEEK